MSLILHSARGEWEVSFKRRTVVDAIDRLSAFSRNPAKCGLDWPPGDDYREAILAHDGRVNVGYGGPVMRSFALIGVFVSRLALPVSDDRTPERVFTCLGQFLAVTTAASQAPLMALPSRDPGDGGIHLHALAIADRDSSTFPRLPTIVRTAE